MAHYLEVYAADQGSERLELAGRLAFVTRGGVRVALPARDCPSELHLLEVEGTPAGAQVSIPQGAPGGFALDGQTQRSAVVPWGGEVFWEGLRLAFVQIAKRNERSPVVLLGLVGILLCGGFAVASKAGHDRASSEPEPPQLAVTPGTCPGGDGEAAQRRARFAERAGLARREQSAFIAADALAALSAFGEAEACYRVAGKLEDADRAAALGRDWSAHLNTDYAARRLRLQQALTQGRDAEALTAATELGRLLAGRSGPYVEWLVALRAELEGRIRRAGS
jgi:hypothetical protein